MKPETIADLRAILENPNGKSVDEIKTIVSAILELGEVKAEAKKAKAKEAK